MSGHSHLFIPGPTNVPERIRQALNMPMEDMRAPDFPDFLKSLHRDMKKVFQTEEGHVFIYPSSGTGAWEAAITNILSPGDRVLMSVYGMFSYRWADMAKRMGLDVEVVDVEWGEGVPLEAYAHHLQEDTKGEIKAVFCCHNETATGVTSDIAAVRRILDDAGHDALLFVDGVSSIASIDFCMDAWGIDCAVSGSQKGFMLPPGLGFLAVSQKALEAHKSSKFSRCYFSFEDMLGAAEKGLYPYTPPVQLLRGLRVALDLIHEEGLHNIFARHHRLAEGVRAAVKAWELPLCAKKVDNYSDTVSTIIVPEHISANKIIQRAYYQYKASFGGGLGVLADRVFRIGHIGDCNEGMVFTSLSIAEIAMLECGVSIRAGAGAGVAAAIEHFRNHDF